jgi:predicted regulator of Ras-like GTPase activity (Roadblock/LC7/MglB family)
MKKIDSVLAKLEVVEGFQGVGIFTPNGELASQFIQVDINLAEIGSIANDVLLRAQKATEIMNVGRGSSVHIEAPNAHVIARCYNENANFSETKQGKVHIHIVLVLKKDGNLAMAKLKLDSIINEITTFF